ncbi:uncharacterized protein LOC128563443 [Nycticebus coucang]|uniref:uncharacterized protein LOC128563443 n=1 Tax=Nycticebus coucang TaxID=9470 RepID=UPI00234CDC06|nr:uncharacterized protein LOC128563443 [Nycticebus coucang]
MTGTQPGIAAGNKPADPLEAPQLPQPMGNGEESQRYQQGMWPSEWPLTPGACSSLSGLLELSLSWAQGVSRPPGSRARPRKCISHGSQSTSRVPESGWSVLVPSDLWFVSILKHGPPRLLVETLPGLCPQPAGCGRFGSAHWCPCASLSSFHQLLVPLQKLASVFRAGSKLCLKQASFLCRDVVPENLETDGGFTLPSLGPSQVIITHLLTQNSASVPCGKRSMCLWLCEFPAGPKIFTGFVFPELSHCVGQTCPFLMPGFVKYPREERTPAVGGFFHLWNPSPYSIHSSPMYFENDDCNPGSI